MIRVLDSVLKIMGSYQRILNHAVISGFLFTRITQTIIEKREFGARGNLTQRNKSFWRL